MRWFKCFLNAFSRFLVFYFVDMGPRHFNNNVSSISVMLPANTLPPPMCYEVLEHPSLVSTQDIDGIGASMGGTKMQARNLKKFFTRCLPRSVACHGTWTGGEANTCALYGLGHGGPGKQATGRMTQGRVPMRSHMGARPTLVRCHATLASPTGFLAISLLAAH